MAWQNHHCAILVGIAVGFVGLGVMIYGNVHTSFWSSRDAIGCDFCREGREATIRTTRNCRIVGPILLGIGVIITIFGLVKLRRAKAQQSGTQFANYATTPTINNTTAPVGGSYVQPAPGAYPKAQMGNYPPPPAGTYPPPVSGTYPSPVSGTYPPPPSGTYPPPVAGTYPPPVAGTYPPPPAGTYPPPVAGTYPPPPAGTYPPPLAGTYPPPPAGTYPPPPASTFPHDPVKMHSTTGTFIQTPATYPPTQSNQPYPTGPPPPCYDDSVTSAPSAPPPY